MANSGKCPVCTAMGLAILPARYTVAPDDHDVPDLKFGGHRVTGVPLSTSKYTARVLRQGFLYLFYEKNHRGYNQWEAYSVSSFGTLHKALDAASVQPVDMPPKCSRCGSSSTRDFVVVEEPKKCGKLWIAFSEYKWDDSVRQMYQDNWRLLRKRMQLIEPSNWIGAPEKGDHTLPVSAAESLEAIAEYTEAYGGMRVSGYPDASQEDGWYQPDTIKWRDTRYEVWGRRGIVITAQGAAAGSAMEKEQLDEHYDVLLAASPDPENDGHHVPMMVALWDAIGNVHELNGFRNDATGWLARYMEERGLEIDAMQKFGEARAAVEGRAKARAERSAGFREVSRMSPTVVSAGMGIEVPGIRQQEFEVIRRAARPHAKDRASADAFASEYLDLEEEYVLERIDLEEFRARRSQLEEKHLYNPGGVAGVVQGQEADATRRRERNIAQREQDIQDAWPDYEKRIDTAALGRFRGYFEAIQKDVKKLQAERTADIKAWLYAPLLLDTLKDYAEDVPADGVVFSRVVEDAIEGLASEENGAALLDELIANLGAASDEKSLFWRAVALNQLEAKQELERVLGALDDNRMTPMDMARGGISVFATATTGLKSFATLYYEYDKIGNSRVPLSQSHMVSSGIVGYLGVDRLLMAAGTRVFGKWRIGALGDYVSENVIRGIFLTRAGIPLSEVRSVLIEQAKIEPALRIQVMNRWRVLRTQGVNPNEAFAIAVDELGRTEGSRTMQAKWQRVRPRSAFGEPRLAAVLALCEAASFAKLISAADKDSEDIMMLVASGMSVTQALTQVALEPAKVLFGDASDTLRNWKAVGGYLGGGAAFIGAVLELSDAYKGYKEGYGLISALYALKGGAGVIVSGAYVLSALSSSAHLIQRVIGRRAVVVFLERVAGSIATATVERALITQGTKVIVQRTAMAALGRGVLMLVGWKVTVVVLVVQGIVWYFTPDDLEKWIDKTSFGSKRRFNDLEQQQKTFEGALADMGLQ